LFLPSNVKTGAESCKASRCRVCSSVQCYFTGWRPPRQ